MDCMITGKATISMKMMADDIKIDAQCLAVCSAALSSNGAAHCEIKLVISSLPPH